MSIQHFSDPKLSSQFLFCENQLNDSLPFTSQSQYLSSLNQSWDSKRNYLNTISGELSSNNQQKLNGFLKCDDFIKQPSIKNLNKNYFSQICKTNDQFSSDHSTQDFPDSNSFRQKWKKIEKDELTEAMIEQYENHIVQLKAQIQDIKEEKRQISEILENQRKFYMSEMYNKELISEEQQFQIQYLKGQLQKQESIQRCFLDRIKLLQLQNAEYEDELNDRIISQQSKSQCQSFQQEKSDLNLFQHSNGKKSTKISFFPSSDRFLSETSNNFQNLRIINQRQRSLHQKQIKGLKQFYESKMRILRKSMSPTNEKPRNSITILDEYICPDNISCDSHAYRSQNLKLTLRQQFNNSKNSSSKQLDLDCQSFQTTKFFVYPNQSKRQIYPNSSLFIEQKLDDESSEFLIRDDKIEIQNCSAILEKQNKQQKNYLVRGIILGSILGLTTGIYLTKSFN